MFCCDTMACLLQAVPMTERSAAMASRSSTVAGSVDSRAIGPTLVRRTREDLALALHVTVGAHDMDLLCDLSHTALVDIGAACFAAASAGGSATTLATSGNRSCWHVRSIMVMRQSFPCVCKQPFVCAELTFGIGSCTAPREDDKGCVVAPDTKPCSPEAAKLREALHTLQFPEVTELGFMFIYSLYHRPQTINLAPKLPSQHRHQNKQRIATRRAHTAMTTSSRSQNKKTNAESRSPVDLKAKLSRRQKPNLT